MQNLYGRPITDRVEVYHDPMKGCYVAKFDGEDIGVEASSGALAVAGAVEWLNAQAAKRAEEERLAEEAKAQDQFNEEETFLYDLSDRLGISKDDLDTLMEIVRRRSEADAS